MAQSTSPSPVGAQTLLNGLRIIQEVARGVRTQAELQEQLGLPRSTVNRLVSALRSEDFLRQGEAGLALGPALVSLGFAALEENQLAEVARPILLELAAEVLDTVHLAVDEQGSVLYLAKISGTRGAETRSRVGLRMPLTRTGIGKSLILDHPQSWREQYRQDAPVAVRRRSSSSDEDLFIRRMEWYRELGFTLDIEENEPGVRCVAAPVRGPRQEIAGAISVTATTPYMPPARMRTLVPVVQDFAARIGRAIGHPEAPSRGVPAGPLQSSPVQGGRRDEILDRVFDFS